MNPTPQTSRLQEFLEPLFKKLEHREVMIWIAFFFFSFSSVGFILHYIYSFEDETDRYSEALTSSGKYHAEYGDLLEEATASPEKNLQKTSPSSPQAQHEGV